MSTIINDYSRFYRGTENLKNYASNDGLKKDTLVKYEFNTTDEYGNKIMDKMSKKEMFKAMNEISAQYGDNVIVQFSGDGMAALIESKKGAAQGSLSDEKMAARNVAFQNEIIHNDISANHLPAYSGMYGVDKTIAAALENCTKEEQAFVYDIIRQNFLVENSSSMAEEERQANIALGMKKAEYAAENFIPEDKREAFLEAMENIAKLASAGKADKDGNMDYGVNKANYLGHGSDIVYTTDPEDMMRRMDSTVYEEYKGLSGKNALKYLADWYTDVLKKNPNIVNEYEQKSEQYMAGVAERKAAQQTEQNKLMEQYVSNPFALSGNCMTLVNLETGEKVNPEPSQWQVFNDSLRKSGYYDDMSDEEIKKTEDILRSITYRVDSIHDLTDYDRHLSDLTHEAARLEFVSSISALNYFADTYLSGDARDSFKGLIKDYEEYNSASVARHENHEDYYAQSMKNIGAPNATGVKEAVRQTQERTRASQEIGRVTHTEEDEAKLYQDYQELFDKLAGGEGNINSIFDDLKNMLIDYASGGSKNSAVSDLLQSQNANSFNNMFHYWSRLLQF